MPARRSAAPALARAAATVPARRRGWHDPATARAYDAFCARHDRYRVANAALVRHAALAGAGRVLDVGAGTGGTTAAALARLAPEARVVCVEPSASMRARGRGRIADPRVRWTARLPAGGPRFDRVLCGASFWLLGAPAAVVPRLAARVAPGGALVFDVPAAYLGVPARGLDPLAAIPAWLVRHGHLARPPSPPRAAPLSGVADLEAILRAAGLRPRRWRVRIRLTQAAYRDWLKIPVVSEGMLAGRSAAARARLLERAYADVDGDAWRWETWLGWTAWKR